MNKNDSLTLLLSGFIVSLLPIFPDPYYHVDRINFWEWARREIDELLTRERMKARYEF